MDRVQAFEKVIHFILHTFFFCPLCSVKGNQTNALIEALLDREKVPGLSVSISQKGELIYSKGFGIQTWKIKFPNPLKLSLE